MRFFITGGTGFVGGHVAEACKKQGHEVVALVRPGSDTGELERMGVKILRGQFFDADLLRTAIADADVVVHCAAKVGDWGPVEEYRAVNVDGLRQLLEASKGTALQRFIHISSLGVYEARDHHGTDESTPPGKNHRDGYSKSKAEAEAVALQYQRDFGVPVVILRPGFVYGPRDRSVLPRIINNLKAGTVRYPGGGHTVLNTIFVRNLTEAIFLAATNDVAVGQVYNLTDGEKVTKRQFIERVADTFGFKHPHLTPPMWFAKSATWIAETVAKLRGAKEAPLFNFTRLKFLGLNLDFSIEKARRELGYGPRTRYDVGMLETLQWYKENLRLD